MHATRLRFYRSLSRTLSAGIPLIQALESSAKLMGEAGATQLRSMVASIKRGVTLGEAARSAPSLFPGAAIAQLQIGEQTGKLPQILNELVRDLEEIIKIRRKLFFMVLYPAALALIWVFLLPLTGYFMGIAKSQLLSDPAAAAHLGSDYRVEVGTRLLWLIGVVAALWFMPKILKRVLGAATWQRLREGLPLIGPPLRLYYASLIAKGMAQGISAGLPIQETLRLAADGSDNTIIVAKASAAIHLVRRGQTLEQALLDTHLLPPAAKGEIAAAETSGTLDKTFAALSVEWRDRLSHELATLSAVISGVLLSVMAFSVVTLLVRQYMSYFEMIFDMTSKIK